jgi:hypothetical protein
MDNQRQQPKRSPLVDVTGLKWGHWYVVEVAFRPGNPIHRAIATDYRENRFVTLFGSYEDDRIPRVNLDTLAYFKVIEPIKAMKEDPEHFLPADADKAKGAA